MDKSQKMNRASRRTRWENFKYWVKKVITFPWRVCCAVWNWLKSIDVVGMVNLTLLVIIIVLFSSLIINFVHCHKCVTQNAGQVSDNVVVVEKNDSIENNRKTTTRRFNTSLPLKTDKRINNAPKIKTVSVAETQPTKGLSLPVDKLPNQILSGDVIVDVSPMSPVLSNGTKVNGNLIIQNMRKYTLPCGMKVNGHLFVRNVERLYFCGSFTVNGNIYVNRQSLFGPLPAGTKINGQIIM